MSFSLGAKDSEETEREEKRFVTPLWNVSSYALIILRRALTLTDLPVEILLEIMKHSHFLQIIILRETSPVFSQLIAKNQRQIVRDQITEKRKHPATLLATLHGLPEDGGIYLEFFSGVYHQVSICYGLATSVMEFIVTEILRRTSKSSRIRFQDQHNGIRRKIMPSIILLFHHFERFRTEYAKELGKGHLPSHRRQFPTSCTFERRLLEPYDSVELLKAYKLYTMFLPAFSRRMRPPTYAGRLERSLRGWSREGPTEDDFAKVLMIGGLSEVARIWNINAYDDRRKALDDWLKSLETLVQDVGRKARQFRQMPPFSQEEEKNRDQRYLASTAIPAWWTQTAPLYLPDLDLFVGNLPDLNFRFIHAAVHTLLDDKTIRSIDDVGSPGEYINDLLGVLDPAAAPGGDEVYEEELEEYLRWQA
ncbi:MAG: hypothetical protein M1833_004213 [Piccolia ochrophora]|nr:MAG: hypothetical protein M1833_004213 [Piccolia ochrophora]